MIRRARIPGLLAPALALLLLTTAAIPARADQAYDRVSAAYEQGGGHLDPCAFTQAQLEAALRGIPPQFRTTVPALRTAIESAIASRKHGECKGVRPEEGTTGGAAVPESAPPPVTTTPAPAATTPTATAPTTTATPPAATAPPTMVPAQHPAATSSSDRKPLVVALIAAGALVLLALSLWAFGRSRGWDPVWSARMRHAWGEAGFRTASTWAEFTDWLRLGR